MKKSTNRTNKKQSSTPSKYLVASALIVAGGVFGLWTFSSAHIPDQYREVSSLIISEGNAQPHSDHAGAEATTYSPIVQYSVNGKTYTTMATYISQANIQIGSSLKVYYDSNNPTLLRTTHSVFTIVLLIVLSSLLFISGIIYAAVTSYITKKNK